MVKQANNGTQRNYGLFIVPNTMRVHHSFQAGNCSSLISRNSNGQMNLNAWNHIAMTYDGSTFNFYLNGVLDRTEALVRTVCNNTFPVKIGDEISASRL